TVTDPNYTGTASGTLVVAKATATVTLGALTQTYDGSARVATATTSPAGLSVQLTYDGSTAAPVNVGSYAVAATVTEPNYTGSVSDTLTVTVTALVRHAPTLNGDLEGSLQLATGEGFTVNGNNYVAGDLLVPGTPAVKLNGHAVLGGTQDSTGAAAPANYTVT